MKQIFIILSFLLFSLQGIAQNFPLKSTRLNNNYTWRNSTLAERQHYYLELPMVQNSDYKTHLRVILIGQIIDFFSADNLSFKGTLTNKIIEYKSSKNKRSRESEEFQIVYHTQKLDSSVSTLLANQLLKSGQYDIPTDSLIKDWNHGYLHCESIDFHFKIDNSYKEKSFSCPWNQSDSIDFKAVILSNLRLLEKELSLEARYNRFESLLKRGITYSRDGYRLMYRMTDREIAAWKKDEPRRKYLKSIKNSLDNYLETELSKQNISLDKIDCIEDYYVTFGTNGKLESVLVSPKDRPTLSYGLGDYFEERQETRKCRKKLKHIFRNIDLSSFNLKYKIRRIVSFWGKGEIRVREATFY